jgi:hypothetical protein
VSAYAAAGWTQAEPTTVPLTGFGLSIGRHYVLGYDDLRGAATRIDEPYSMAVYCDEEGLCPPQQTRVYQRFRTIYVARRYDLAPFRGLELAIMPKLGGSFVSEAKKGLESQASLSGSQASITGGLAVEVMRAVRGVWMVSLAGEARWQIKEPPKCFKCYTPFRTGFSQQQISLGITRRADW